MNRIKIAIGADIVPTKINAKSFIDPTEEDIISPDLDALLTSCDYRIFNCESPLTDSNKPIIKNGPHLKSSPKSINGFKKLKVDFLTLANNHIMDYGTEGLIDTIRVLKNDNIAFCGAGNNREDASQPFVVNISGYNVGIYCCVEHEFSFATNHAPGANAFNPLYSLEHISKLKTMCDLLIVLYHGGKELYQYPTPNLQEICHRTIDYGADIVFCQHSHCIGAKEKYKNKEILYGQGNFIFERTNDPRTKEGFLAIVNYNRERFYVEYVPVMVKNGCASLADDYNRKRILSEFEARSRHIESPENIQHEFEKLCKRLLKNYLFAMRSGNIAEKIVNKASNGFYIKQKYNAKKALRPLNFIECETHREILIKCLENMTEALKEKY